MGVLGAVSRFIGFERDQYHATQLESPVKHTVSEVDRTLLEFSLHPENHGPESMAGVYQSMHQPATCPTFSVEIWFHKGQARFFLTAENDELADDIRQSVTNNYEDTQVETVSPDAEAFPTADPDDYACGAYAVKDHPWENHPYLPIAYYDDGVGWRIDLNPIGELIAKMQSGAETSVVVQVTLQPLPDSWTVPPFPRSLFEESAAEIKEGYREDGKTDLKKMVGKQTSQTPFTANIRVLAISPSESVARNRASSVAGVFERRFTSEVCGMGLSARPVDARTDSGQRSKMHSFISKMVNRKFSRTTCTQLGDKELTAVQFPCKESGAPGIDWRNSRTGSEAPVNRPEHTVPDSLDDIDPDRLPSVGGRSHQSDQKQEQD